MAVSPDWLTEQWDLMSSQPWFRGFMTREEACALLDQKPTGSFVVRVSASQPGHYAISVVQPNNHFEHMLILPSWVRGTPLCPMPHWHSVYRLLCVWG